MTAFDAPEGTVWYIKFSGRHCENPDERLFVLLDGYVTHNANHDWPVDLQHAPFRCAFDLLSGTRYDFSEDSFVNSHAELFV